MTHATDLALPTLGDVTQLSDAGSTRATAYTMANKAVRIGNRTAFTWLDAVSSVRLAIYDHDAGQWQTPTTLGEGADNHTNPAITATPDGRLRIAYGPHGYWGNWNCGRFTFTQSEPGDWTQWADYNTAGYNATYASFVTDAQGRDHIAYRGGAGPCGCYYQRRDDEAGWDRCTQLSAMKTKPGYTHVQNNIALGPAGEVYAGFHYYSAAAGHSAGVCALKSADGGTTWTALNGEPVTLPLHYDDKHAIPHAGGDPRLGSLAVDAKGRLLAYTYDAFGESNTAHFAVHDQGGWRTVWIDEALPDGLMACAGKLTVDAQGRILIAAEVQPIDLGGEKRWSHPSTEIWLLASIDGGESFTAMPVSTPEPSAANWLATISAPGPNHDLRTPVIAYTQGVSGEGCSPSDHTKVFAAIVQ